MKLAVLIVTWNNSGTLDACLEAVTRQNGIEKRVLVWDNASTDASGDIATRWLGADAVVRSTRNVGFARGMNELAELATDADAVLLLNPDAVVRETAIAELLRILSGGAGIAGGRLEGPDGVTQIACCRPFPRAIRLAFWLLTRWSPTWSVPECVTHTDAVSGAFMAVRADVWRALDGFDTEYPHSGEDLDLCWRARRNGYPVVFTPDAEAVHQLGASVSQAPPEIDVLRWHGILRFARQHDGRLRAALLRGALYLQTSALLAAAALGVPRARRRELVRARLLKRWAATGRLPQLPTDVAA